MTFHQTGCTIQDPVSRKSWWWASEFLGIEKNNIFFIDPQKTNKVDRNCYIDLVKTSLLPECRRHYPGNDFGGGHHWDSSKIHCTMEQKLSYRKQIARQLHRQCVEGIKYYTVTLKSRLRITQGHWKRNHWIYHTRLTISRVFEYYRDLKMWVRGHSRSLKVVPLNFESLSTVSYSPSIVTVAASLAISEVFSVKEWPNLEVWVWGCSRSLKMARFDRPCMTFY